MKQRSGFYIIHSHNERESCTSYCYYYPKLWNRMRATIKARLAILGVK